MKALLIPVAGPATVIDLPSGGARLTNALRALIGTGCAERLQVTSRWEAWLDEDGAAAGKPVNQAATLVARSFGFEVSFLGAVVIAGVDKNTNRRPCHQPRPGPSWRGSGSRLPDAGLVEAAVQHGREGEHAPSMPSRNAS